MPVYPAIFQSQKKRKKKKEKRKKKKEKRKGKEKTKNLSLVCQYFLVLLYITIYILKLANIDLQNTGRRLDNSQEYPRQDTRMLVTI
jgi:cytoskeletal protein RodZ